MRLTIPYTLDTGDKTDTARRRHRRAEGVRSQGPLAGNTLLLPSKTSRAVASVSAIRRAERVAVWLRPSTPKLSYPVAQMTNPADIACLVSHSNGRSGLMKPGQLGHVVRPLSRVPGVTTATSPGYETEHAWAPGEPSVLSALGRASWRRGPVSCRRFGVPGAERTTPAATFPECR